MHLRDNPLVRTLCSLQENIATGSLLLSKNGDRITIYFRDGLINAASTDLMDYQLGRYFVQRGYIEQDGIKTLAQEAAERRALIGETAVSKGLLDSSELMELVQEQAVQALAHAMKSGFEAKAFDRTEPPSLYMPAGIGRPQLMLELARKNLQPFNLHPDMLITLRNGSLAAPLAWLPAELLVLSELCQPRTIHELSVATGLEHARISKILFVFDALQLLSVIENTPADSTALVRRRRLPFESLVPEIQKSAVSKKLETLREESSFISEQFKTLKVRIGELAAAHHVKVITFSSPAPEDGKSLTCLNLAASYSRDSNRRVILLDCDLRNPSLHRYLGIPVEPGLMNYLEDDSIQPYSFMRRLDNLYILTAGGIASNPLELLSQDKMVKLLDYLKSEFEIILLDSPPLSPISDSQVLIGLSDAYILVIRSGKTKYGDLDRGMKSVDRTKLMGIVFNDIRPAMFNTQYDYRYYGYRNRGLYPYSSKSNANRRGSL
jgi:capsular exopolysaccharide synthesis family protein